MITAVDTNVLLDILTGDPQHGPASRTALDRCFQQGSVIAAAAVWAEVSAAYPDAAAGTKVLERMQVAFEGDDLEVATHAGAAWRSYRRAGGTRRRIMTDFLIGAHAAKRADRLLTRDRGFYRAHFGLLLVMEP